MSRSCGPCRRMKNRLFSIEALPKLLALAERRTRCSSGAGWPLGYADRDRLYAARKGSVPDLLLDADGINAITAHKDILRRTAKPVVLTPHAGEFARLKWQAGCDRFADAAQFAQDYRVSCSTKGHRTRILRQTAQRTAIPRAIPAWRKGGRGCSGRHAGFALCGLGH